MTSNTSAAKRRLLQATRALVTLAAVGAGTWAVLRLWDHYELSPWTRDGRVRANVVQIAPDVSGLVSDVAVHDNQPVHAGDPLFRVDRARYELAVRQAETVLAVQRIALAGARPGSGNYSLVVHGRSAHAGRNPDDGRNALVAAADLALRLEALKRDGLSVNPARIEGGSPSNVVPDLAVLRVNLRPRTPKIEEEAKLEIEAAISSVAAQRDVRIDAHGGFGRPPKPMTTDMEKLFGLVKQAGGDLGQQIGWQSTGGVCDGNNIAACGVPVVDTMGVRGGKIHSMEEFLITQSLGERAALSALTILRIAEGRL